MILIILQSCFSQSKKDYEDTILMVEAYYNSGQYEAIYNMFSKIFKSVATKDDSVTYFNDRVTPLGKIKNTKYDKFENGFHHYKTIFDNGTFLTLITLNKNGEITRFTIKPFNNLERNTTKMIWPFKEAAFLFWGGATEKENYHVAYKNQQYAYDIVMVKDGKTHNSDENKNQDYYIFGKDIIAPCYARVVTVVSGIYDNIPYKKNHMQATGNTVVLKTDANEYLLFAHLKKGSIQVKEDDELKQGDIIAQYGNFGNSSKPHLHLSLQNHQYMSKATGAKLYFDKSVVNNELKTDYLPVKGDVVKNVK